MKYFLKIMKKKNKFVIYYLLEIDLFYEFINQFYLFLILLDLFIENIFRYYFQIINIYMFYYRIFLFNILK